MRQTVSIVLASILLAQATPGLVEIVSFFAQREALTERYCINVAAPTLDCRAACYLQDQLVEVAADASSAQETGLGTTASQQAPSFLSYISAKHAVVIVAGVQDTAARRRCTVPRAEDTFLRGAYLVHLERPPIA